MTFFGKLMALFPAFHTVLVLVSLVFFVFHPRWYSVTAIPLVIYLFPLTVFHCHQFLAPVKEGEYDLTKGYSAWFGSHMLQNFFITFPITERFLRLFPGVFSLWLRLWGSGVGKNVYWTPDFEVADRSLLIIGNNVVFGYAVKISCHMINPSRKMGLKNTIKKVEIQDGVFVGAGTRITPGVLIKKGAVVKAKTDIYPNSVIEAS